EGERKEKRRKKEEKKEEKREKEEEGRGRERGREGKEERKKERKGKERKVAAIEETVISSRTIGRECISSNGCSEALKGRS
ncbi:hypothetical protein ACC718_39110, partial [Rhizobium ruizarguesonis]